MPVHALRKTNQSFRNACGQSLKFRSEEAGHASTQITDDLYTSTLENYREQEVNKLESFLKSNELVTNEVK